MKGETKYSLTRLPLSASIVKLPFLGHFATHSLLEFRYLGESWRPSAVALTRLKSEFSALRPVLTPGPTLVTPRPWKRMLFGFRLPANVPERQKISYDSR